MVWKCIKMFSCMHNLANTNHCLFEDKMVLITLFNLVIFWSVSSVKNWNKRWRVIELINTYVYNTYIQKNWVKSVFLWKQEVNLSVLIPISIKDRKRLYLMLLLWKRRYMKTLFKTNSYESSNNYIRHLLGGDIKH